MAQEDILKIVSMGDKKPVKKKEDEKKASSTLRILDILQENLPKPQEEEEDDLLD